MVTTTPTVQHLTVSSFNLPRPERVLQGPIIGGVDMDGVIANFHAGWVKAYNTQFVDIHPPIPDKEPPSWEVHPYCHFSSDEEWFNWLRDEHPKIFSLLPKYNDAEGALWTLRNLWGYHIAIVTDKPDWAINCTYEWLPREIPDCYDSVHITKKKFEVVADFYVDDRTENIESLVRERPGATVIRLEKPYNQQVVNSFTASTWADVMEILTWREAHGWEALPWQYQTQVRYV